MSGRTLAISLTLLLVAAIGVEVETAGPLPGSRSPDGIHMILPDGEANRYWPRWRGPTGQGLAQGAGYPDTWSATQNVLWQVEVPGRGNSSPIVWGDRIFLTTARDGGKRPSVLCYRRSDGKLLWESTLQAGEPGRVYWKNSHASGTPFTDGQVVYASFGNQGLAAVDFQGKVVWRHSLGTIRNYHGSAGSPVLYKDRIFLYEDQRQGAFLAAFDRRTGKTLWKTERKASVGWGTPIVIRAGDRDELIVSSQAQVTAYDPASGTALWHCGGNLAEVIPTPVVGHGLVFCVSGRAGPTLAIRPGGSGDVTRTHLAWKQSKGASFVPSPLLYGDLLYQVNDMVSVATCYRAATGEVLWQGRLGEPKSEGFSASPVGVDGKVFFTNDAGETFVLKAGNRFELLRVNRLEAAVLASPALVDGRWYFRTDRHLLAIGN